jgi:tRNA (Thr-GGU) A37 N-methylase
MLARATLTLRPDIPSSALDGLHEYSHVWLLFEFNGNTNKSVRAKVKIKIWRLPRKQEQSLLKFSPFFRCTHPD